MEFDWSEKNTVAGSNPAKTNIFRRRIDLKWVRHLPNIKSKSMFAKKSAGKLFRRLIFTLIQLFCPALVFREVDLYTCLCLDNWLPHVYFGSILSEKNLNFIGNRTRDRIFPTNQIPFCFTFFFL